jgi:hypothetical protein
MKESCGGGEFKYDIFDALYAPLSLLPCTSTQHNNKEKNILSLYFIEKQVGD